jgi:hypothetical protein
MQNGQLSASNASTRGQKANGSHGRFVCKGAPQSTGAGRVNSTVKEENKAVEAAGELNQGSHRNKGANRPVPKGPGIELVRRGRTVGRASPRERAPWPLRSFK